MVPTSLASAESLPPANAPFDDDAFDDDSGVPDLLHPRPMTRVDLDQTKLAIAMAFASGVSGGLFADALARATFAPSTSPTIRAASKAVRRTTSR